MLSNATQRMAKLFPQWMKAYYNPEDSTTIQFLEAFGKRIDNFESLIKFIMDSPYLEVDSEDFSFYNIDYIYKIEMHPEQIGEFNNLIFEYTEDREKVIPEMISAETIYQFYTSDNLNIYYYDTINHTIYMRRKYNSIIANGAKFTNIEAHHVWGIYDEIGLLLACPRLTNEHNTEYVSRILNVFQDPGNATKKGLTNYLARSLDIEKDQISFQEIDDKFIDNNIEESISKELQEFIDLSNNLNIADENTYWDIIENNAKGLQYLPIPWKKLIKNIDSEYIQNGVRKLSNLIVKEPSLEDTIYETNYIVSAVYPSEQSQEIYPEVEVGYSVNTEVKIEDPDGEPYSTEYKYKIVAGKITPLEFSVQLEAQYKQIIEYIINNTAPKSLDYKIKAILDNKELQKTQSGTTDVPISAGIDIVEEAALDYSLESNRLNLWNGASITKLKNTPNGLSLI